MFVETNFTEVKFGDLLTKHSFLNLKFSFSNVLITALSNFDFALAKFV